MWHGSNVSNSTILARLISFCPTASVEEDSGANGCTEVSEDVTSEAIVARLNVLETLDSTSV